MFWIIFSLDEIIFPDKQFDDLVTNSGCSKDIKYNINQDTNNLFHYWFIIFHIDYIEFINNN